MTPEIVRHLDFWLEALVTFPTTDPAAYLNLVRRYRETLESL